MGNSCFGLLGVAALAILFFAIFPGLAPGWTGFGYQPHPNGWIMIPYKTLWDWMELLLVPLFIAFGAALLGWRQQQRQLLQQAKDRDIAEQGRENEQEIAHEQGQQLGLEAYYQSMGTLILKAALSLVDAQGVDLRGAKLETAALDGADLSEALLHGADLSTVVFDAMANSERSLLLQDVRNDAATR